MTQKSFLLQSICKECGKFKLGNKGKIKIFGNNELTVGLELDFNINTLNLYMQTFC